MHESRLKKLMRKFSHVFVSESEKRPVEGVPQNVHSRYLLEKDLQTLLHELFPDQKDFNIRLKEDQWTFNAPRNLTEEEMR